MDFSELKKIVVGLDKYGLDRKAFVKAEMSMSGKNCTFTTGRLGFVVNHGVDGIDEVEMYGLHPIFITLTGLEKRYVVGNVAEANGVNYCDVTPFSRKRKEGVVRNMDKYASFVMVPQIHVDGDIERCARKIYAAQDALVHAFEKGSLEDEASGVMGDRPVKKRSASGRRISSVYNEVFIGSDGREISVGERIYALGTEREIYKNCGWDDVSLQLLKESGFDVERVSVNKYFLGQVKKRGMFVGPLLPTIENPKSIFKMSSCQYKRVVEYGGTKMTVDAVYYDIWKNEGGDKRSTRLNGLTIEQIANKGNEVTGLGLIPRIVRQRIHKHRRMLEVAASR